MNIPQICRPFLRDIARNPFSVHARMAFLDFLDERENPIQEKQGKDIVEYQPQYFKDWSEFIKCHIEMEKQRKGEIVASKKNDKVQDALGALHERLLAAHNEWIKIKCPNPNCDRGRDSTLEDVSSFCLTCGGSEDLLKTARGDQPRTPIDVRRRNVAWFQGHIVRVSCKYDELGKMGRYAQGEFKLDVSKWCTALCLTIPVVNFYITDKTPFHITEWGLSQIDDDHLRHLGVADERGNFFFRSQDVVMSNFPGRHDITPYIFDHLEGYALIEDEPHIKFYKTLAQANGALGLACGKVVRSHINWEEAQ